ncbi:MAG: hypothetical protein D6806_17770 [Deltaproteobacteria bacterium]|nr:MAG: hypothetical protein D6806_17770 [Deltaproteobacteria bacterium]
MSEEKGKGAGAKLLDVIQRRESEGENPIKAMLRDTYRERLPDDEAGSDEAGAPASTPAPASTSASGSSSSPKRTSRKRKKRSSSKEGAASSGDELVISGVRISRRTRAIIRLIALVESISQREVLERALAEYYQRHGIGERLRELGVTEE